MFWRCKKSFWTFSCSFYAFSIFSLYSYRFLLDRGPNSFNFLAIWWVSWSRVKIYWFFWIVCFAIFTVSDRRTLNYSWLESASSKSKFILFTIFRLLCAISRSSSIKALNSFLSAATNGCSYSSLKSISPFTIILSIKSLTQELNLTSFGYLSFLYATTIFNYYLFFAS